MGIRKYSTKCIKCSAPITIIIDANDKTKKYLCQECVDKKTKGQESQKVVMKNSMLEILEQILLEYRNDIDDVYSGRVDNKDEYDITQELIARFNELVEKRLANQRVEFVEDLEYIKSKCVSEELEYIPVEDVITKYQQGEMIDGEEKSQKG